MTTDSSAALGVIPARANSSRFPLKVITPIAGKPMIQYVWEAACQARTLSRVVVATDDERVADVVRGFGGEVTMTPSTLPSGTDRVALIAKDCPQEIVVNLQGDEPLLQPGAIDRLVEALRSHPHCGMATLAVRSDSTEALASPNVVKVVLSDSGEALYFSRQALCSDPRGGFLKHIGIYAYRRDILQAFCSWPPGELEKTERLEQLRALAHGVPLFVTVVEHDTVAVDEPSDVRKVESVLEKASANRKGGR